MNQENFLIRLQNLFDNLDIRLTKLDTQLMVALIKSIYSLTITMDVFGPEPIGKTFF